MFRAIIRATKSTRPESFSKRYRVPRSIDDMALISKELFDYATSIVLTSHKSEPKFFGCIRGMSRNDCRLLDQFTKLPRAECSSIETKITQWNDELEGQEVDSRLWRMVYIPVEGFEGGEQEGRGCRCDWNRGSRGRDKERGLLEEKRAKKTREHIEGTQKGKGCVRWCIRAAIWLAKPWERTWPHAPN